MHIPPSFKSKFAACFAAAVLMFANSCDKGLSPRPAPATLALVPLAGPVTLAVCPSSQTQSASRIISLLGGTVAIGGTSVVVPLGALLSPTSIALEIPASQLMYVDVTANGGSFLFKKAIAITIDYSRCSAAIKQKTLSVWNIDPNTHALLQNMGGIDNKLTHQITFTTIHLSGYALAF